MDHADLAIRVFFFILGELAVSCVHQLMIADLVARVLHALPNQALK
jgi:hypothetical protein